MAFPTTSATSTTASSTTASTTESTPPKVVSEIVSEPVIPIQLCRASDLEYLDRMLDVPSNNMVTAIVSTSGTTTSTTISSVSAVPPNPLDMITSKKDDTKEEEEEEPPNITGVKRTGDQMTSNHFLRPYKKPRRYFQGPSSAFNYYAKEQRVVARSQLCLLPGTERTPQLLRWWKNMPADQRQPWIKLAHADKIRHAIDTECLRVLEDVITDVCDEPRMPTMSTTSSASSSSAASSSSSSTYHRTLGDLRSYSYPYSYSSSNPTKFKTGSTATTTTITAASAASKNYCVTARHYRLPGTNQRDNFRWGGNKTGFNGVYASATLKFKAGICVNKKNFHLGTYNFAEDAARAFDRAAIQMGRPITSLNFPESIPTFDCMENEEERKEMLLQKVNGVIDASNPCLFRGVSKQGTRYAASISINKKKVHVGIYRSAPLAAAAFDRAALDAGLPLSFCNFPDHNSAYWRVRNREEGGGEEEEGEEEEEEEEGTGTKTIAKDVEIVNKIMNKKNKRDADARSSRHSFLPVNTPWHMYKGVVKRAEDWFEAVITIRQSVELVGNFSSPRDAAIAVDYALFAHGQSELLFNFPVNGNIDEAPRMSSEGRKIWTKYVNM